MKYTLNVKETKNKAGRFHYTVTDELGNIYSERRSNREYVACTLYGSHYFGRIDLIGKGDHGKTINRQPERNETTQPIAYRNHEA